MKNSSQISEYIARQCKPELFRKPDSDIYHVALLAFPHTSQTLCGIHLIALEATKTQPPPYLLCEHCTRKLGLLAAKLLIE